MKGEDPASILFASEALALIRPLCDLIQLSNLKKKIIHYFHLHNKLRLFRKRYDVCIWTG